jgi:hypothetical protein
VMAVRRRRPVSDERVLVRSARWLS